MRLMRNQSRPTASGQNSGTLSATDDPDLAQLRCLPQEMDRYIGSLVHRTRGTENKASNVIATLEEAQKRRAPDHEAMKQKITAELENISSWWILCDVPLSPSTDHSGTEATVKALLEELGAEADRLHRAKMNVDSDGGEQTRPRSRRDQACIYVHPRAWAATYLPSYWYDKVLDSNS